MNFASDNVMGASLPVMEALVRANEGAMPAYGSDPITKRVEARLSEVFEREVTALLVATGTAANALALSAMTPPFRSILCHANSHVMEDECGAAEFYTGGAKLEPLPGVGGRIAPETLREALAAPRRTPHHILPATLSLTQATESGCVYDRDTLAALADIAHGHGLGVHMDGARFANALVSLSCSPAEATWKAGVDALSFGATKNGCFAAEAILVFDPARAPHLAERRMRAGHLLSKSRLLAAQLEAYLAGDHWLANARHANRMAARLSAGLAALPGVRLAWPTEANEVFPILPRPLDEALRRAGAVYHPWSDASLPAGEAVGPGERLVRLVTSFATEESQVDRFVETARKASRQAAA
jgi:threonine aldolase